MQENDDRAGLTHLPKASPYVTYIDKLVLRHS